MRSDRERLLDIKEAIERIEKYAMKEKKVFKEDELIQNWIIHHLQIIGEAVYRLSHDFRNEHKCVPWSKIIGMRHILVHDYFEIDVDIVWNVVDRDLPILKSNIDKILNEFV